MAAETTETATPQPTETSAPPPAAPPKETTLAEHEAQFGRKKPAAPPPEAPTTPPQAAIEAPKSAERQRATKQEATAAEVPRIQELTRKWREAERRAELAEARAAAYQQPQAAPKAPESNANGFTTPEPKLADFLNEEDPHASWLAARQDWKADKRDYERSQAQNKAALEVQNRQGYEAAMQVASTHQTRVQDFAKSHADFSDAMDRSEREFGAIPDVLSVALVSDDKGPELMYYFATHPDELAEVAMVAAPLEVTESSVELLRRRIAKYARGNGAQSTEPPPIVPPKVAPRPPSSVGTGPLKTGDEPPSDDDMSIANHEKYFGRRRR